jgi:hypothetical protein
MSLASAAQELAHGLDRLQFSSGLDEGGMARKVSSS